MIDIKSKCKRCGKEFSSKEMTLDPDYKMVVCPVCVREKNLKQSVHKELDEMRQKKSFVQEVEEKKPTGYDYEDAYLEKVQKRRVQEGVFVEKIDNENVRYSCPKCKYKFKYNFINNYPPKCPYCDSPIAKIRY